MMYYLIERKGTRKGLVKSLPVSDALNWVRVNLGIGLSPTRHQASGWTTADLFH